MTNRFLLFASIALVPASCAPRSGGDTPTAPDAAETLEPENVTVLGERLLLYLEHAPLVRGEAARFLAHLTVRTSGEPLRSGRATLEIGSASYAVEGPERDGLFVPQGALPGAGSFPAKLVVDGGEVAETLDLGRIVVHPDRSTAREAAQGGEGEPEGAVTFLMEQQWRIRLLVAEAQTSSLVARLDVPARVTTPEGHEAVVSAPVSGRLLPAEDRRLPRTGERVEAGEVLALVEPPLGASELAEIRALRLELELKRLDAERAVDESKARLRFAERDLERLASLREKGLSTRQELERAEQDLVVARSAEASARATKSTLESLVQTATAARLPLLAPIDGTVTSVRRVEGESLIGGDEVARIVDGSRSWIEGRVSEFDLARLGPAPGAVATFAALPGKRVELASPYLGTSVDPDSRTLQIRYEVENDGELRSGMLAELAIATRSVPTAVAIPREAVVLDRGMPTAYVMLDGEHFQRREIELGVRDGELVEVSKGIAAGERVATRGAHLVRLAGLDPDSFGPQHHH